MHSNDGKRDGTRGKGHTATLTRESIRKEIEERRCLGPSQTSPADPDSATAPEPQGASRSRRCRKPSPGPAPTAAEAGAALAVAGGAWKERAAA